MTGNVAYQIWSLICYATTPLFIWFVGCALFPPETEER